MRDMMIMGLVGTGTLAMRSVFIVGSATLPPRFERLMRFAKPAILAALVGGFVGTGLRVETVAALAAAWFVARKGGGMATMLAVGILLAAVIPD